MPDRVKEIRDFYNKVSKANKESVKREAFKDLLNRIFTDSIDTRSIVDAITAGAEKTVLNIPRRESIHRGAADTSYNKVIIEFENNLKTTLKHAKEQLAGYLLGEFRSGNGFDFTLIASDLLTWRVYTLPLSAIEILDSIQEQDLALVEIETSSFILRPGNEDDFYFWIDRFLFKEERSRPTLERIEETFGNRGLVFQESYFEMRRHFEAVKDNGEVKVSYEQWKKTLSIAYDSFNDSTNNFLIHTYLSIFSKMLAYQVISNDDYIDDDEIVGIIDGSVFLRLNVENFVEDDFFAWIRTAESRHALRSVFRRIAQELSCYDFTNIDEDILKGVYQNLIDLDTRQKLGEYYTPDWLCERIVAEFDFKPSEKILDPACGSGSFLRAVVAKLKRDLPNATIEDINSQVHGIDIHPLSVQIAKTTLLLALGRKGVNDAHKPVHLNVLLANTLLTPRGIGQMFGSEFRMEIDKERLRLDSAIFDDPALFDIGLETADELATQTAGNAAHSLAKFRKALEQGRGICLTKPEIVQDFHNIYLGFKAAKESGRDSIWKFIVQNLYKPYFMEHKFDYVIGNPPWFTYSSIRNEAYQKTLEELARAYDVKPKRTANFPHLEIAAIFLAYCSSFFLKGNGKIAFVLPRAFFSADHHDNTRSGRAERFTLTQLWDLDGVAPLFRVPSCVLFGETPSIRYLSTGEPAGITAENLKQQNIDSYMSEGIPGVAFSGRLERHNGNLNQAEPRLSERNTTYYYLRQGGSSAFSERKSANPANNPYKQLFKQGATIVPRNFYFVELDQAEPPDYKDRVLSIKTVSGIDAKKPWDRFAFADRIESRFLFRTALSKSILPFALYKPSLVALPATIAEDEMGIKKMKLHSAKSLRDEGFLNAARWFKKTESAWEAERTEINRETSATEYLNWKGKITSQDLNAPYLVLYNSSAVNANATVVKREDIDLEFVVESVCYAFYTNDEDEAHYLTSILNSSVPNELMKDFQARGLYGARHVHRKILDVYWPRFDADNGLHIELAALSQEAHEKTRAFLVSDPPEGDLTAHRLGSLRLAIKDHLRKELVDIDNLVKKLIRS